MTIQQTIVFATLVAALVLFAWGRWRYDVVAMLSLMVLSIAGIVPAAEAFSGFGHPAVITVAAVLVLGRGLQNSGAIDILARGLSRVGDNPTVQILSLSGAVAMASAFMNNVGALALFLPVALRLARKSGTPASFLLMPLAFASLLGGLVTLIGTPPNIIIATFRAANGAEPFRMFDFAPVGGGVALAGVLFIALAGSRLIPRRKGQGSREDLFEVSGYVTEIRLPEMSGIVGKTVRDIERVNEAEAVVLGIVRGERRLLAPSGFEMLRAGDVLIIEADPESLQALVDATGAQLVGGKKIPQEAIGSDEIGLVEAVVTPGSQVERKTARDLNLRWQYGVNLLAVSRQGARLRERLGSIRFQAGDILLLQGRTEAMPEALKTLGCFPLAERGLRIGQPRRVLLPVAIFASALGAASLGLLPAQVSLMTAALLMILVNRLSLREAYESVSWPVIVLLGAMIPVAGALETTGGAQRIASFLLKTTEWMPPAGTLAALLIGTMLLSNVVNNAAAAVLMAPIAIRVAAGVGASVDPFLMAVAIGASCAFLTPIGHQSNTLVMGPGGYRFGDYWRLGLPLGFVTAAVSVPLIVRFWPL